MRKYLSIALIFTFSLTFSQKKKEHYLLPHFNLIPPGIVKVETNFYEVSNLYMHDFEVTNEQYREFLNNLLAKNKAEEYLLAYPDSTKWKFKNLSFKSYFTSKKYKLYPVVCVSYEGASMYCKWLEDISNSKNPPEYQVQVRLPMETEWLLAAIVMTPHIDSDSLVIYGTGGIYIKNGKGCHLANFKEYSINYMNGNKQLIPLKPSNSFNPNDFGIYNMSGNVAEMLFERGKTKGGHWNSAELALRVTSVEYFSSPSVYVGFRPMMVIRR